MNILVTGANGQLGKCIQDVVNEIGNGHPDHTSDEKNYYIFADHEMLDITNEEQVKEFITKNFINVVVNCAAYTNVDKAEEDEIKALRVNASGPRYLATACASNGAVMIQISTDYVFNGKSKEEYTPTEMTCPINRYGSTKSIGEEMVANNSNGHYLIFRTSWLYSEYGKNFVKTIYNKLDNGENLKVVDDQVGSPTYALDLAKFIVHIIEDNTSETRYLSKRGIWHFCNKGKTSWYEFAKKIEKHVYKDTDLTHVEPCKTEDFPRPAKRPKYSVMNCDSTEEDFDFKIENWENSLYNCIWKLYGQNKG